MANELSDEDREKYIQFIDSFRRVRAGIEGQIRVLEGLAQEKREYLTELLEEGKLPGASRECPVCRIVSMKHLGTFPDVSHPDLDDPQREVYTPRDKYECLLFPEHKYEEPLPTP